MAEPITYHDLEFHFTHGEPLFATVQVGRDTLVDSPSLISITINGDESTDQLFIHRSKLNGERRTTRVVKPDNRNGESILEL